MLTSVINYKYKDNSEIIVNLSNLTTNTVTIQPKLILCEVQPVTIDHDSINKLSEEIDKDVLDQVHVDNSDTLNEEQKQKVTELLQKH